MTLMSPRRMFQSWGSSSIDVRRSTRPTLRYQVEQYDEHQRRRLDIRPGLTGWAQVHGRASLPWAERIDLDVWYVENRSPKVDLGILLRTPLALFRGTYRGATGGWRA